MAIAVTTAMAGIPAGAEVVDRIVAIVNDDVITLSDLNTAFEPYMARINEAYKGNEKTKMIAEGKMTVLNRLIDNKLVDQYSKKMGVAVKDEEVMSTIRGIMAQRKIDLSDFVKILEREGQTFEFYKEEIKGQMTRQRLVRREVSSKIAVTEEEIGEYYKQHREDYEGKEAVRIKQILLLLPKNANTQAREALRKNAQEIRARLLAGEPFDIMAAKFTQGPAAQQGGDVGFIEKGNTLPEVEAAAFSLKLDEISEVIESSLGFHIIKVVDKKGGGLKTFPEVRQEIQMKIEDQKMIPRVDQWLLDLRKKAQIEIKL
jgi:parvulin-like peptidyl-prolyl isomerase